MRRGGGGTDILNAVTNRGAAGCITTITNREKKEMPSIWKTLNFLPGCNIISSYIPTCTGMHEGKKTSQGQLIRTKNIKASGKRENKDKKRNAKAAFCTSLQTACSFIYPSNTTEQFVARQLCVQSVVIFFLYF